jgi:MFS family permease
MQLIAVNWHIYELLRDDSISLVFLGQQFDLNAGALGLGALGLVRVMPIITFALIGGILADIRERRRVIIWTQSAAAIFAAMLAFITFIGADSVWAIYLLSAAVAAASAFERPAQQSLVPNLVSRKDLTNAVSLNFLQQQFATILGPALAGVLVGFLSLEVVYAVNTVTFIVLIVAVLLMRYRGQAAAQISGTGWSALKEGVQFTFSSRLIRSTMLLDFFATFFSSARTMLPIVADEILDTGVQGYGLLATAQPVGSVIAGAITSLRSDINRQGMVLLVSVAVYGLATALFGLSTIYALSYILFGLTGAGDTVSSVIRGTIRQIMTPDHLRGRMTGINMMFFMGGPQLGELEAGVVAALFGAPFAIVTGGLATVLLTGWVAWKYPRLRNYTIEDAVEFETV